METSRRSVVVLRWRGVAGLALATLVILASVSAGTWWAAKMRWVSNARGSMAAHHAFEVRSAEKLLAKVDAGAYFGADTPELKEKARELLNEQISFHKEREQRYLDAAARPWSKEPEYKVSPPPVPLQLMGQALKRALEEALEQSKDQESGQAKRLAEEILGKNSIAKKSTLDAAAAARLD